MIYLDNAATSFPKPRTVVEAVMKQLEQVGGNAGRSGHQGGLATSRVLYETRCLISQLINCSDPLQINFTLNATEALNLAIHGALSTGDHVVTTSMEHNSVLRPLKEAEEKGVSHTIVWGDREGRVDPAEVEKALRPETRMIILNHCSNVTGTLQPLKEMVGIAKKHSLLILIDASQSCGCIPIDVKTLQIDLLAAPGHKALLGPQGTGFLYIDKKHKIKTLKQGGTGSRSEDLRQPETIPDYYESGTQNSHGLAGLKAGVQFVLDQGVDAIHDHERQQVRRLMEGLSVIPRISLYGPPPEHPRGSVVAFRAAAMDVNQTNYVLDNIYGISARSGLHCAPLVHQTLGTFPEGTIRFSPGIFTTSTEVDATLKAVNEVMKQLS
ncbi:MAG: aminotransferase class V-fold PLP-dependent enzyme [Bacillota bacterium]|nr:aminotransferase class V-fold PLP-dependent enzyme [Bacillota bacterium]MDW7677963.1 aminotransferase class V-fold PLP-dependent enzyme [Bacillota bacterium]